jgi:hypothetical protein
VVAQALQYRRRRAQPNKRYIIIETSIFGKIEHGGEFRRADDLKAPRYEQSGSCERQKDFFEAAKSPSLGRKHGRMKLGTRVLLRFL